MDIQIDGMDVSGDHEDLQARVNALERDNQYLHGFVEALQERLQALEARVNGDSPNMVRYHFLKHRNKKA